MNKELLMNKLNEHFNTKENKIIFHSERLQNAKFSKLRDAVYDLDGNILEEDLDDNIYVASIKGGTFNANYAYVAMQLTDEEVSFAIYAMEGLINQHTSEKVLEKLLKVLKVKNV